MDFDVSSLREMITKELSSDLAGLSGPLDIHVKSLNVATMNLDKCGCDGNGEGNEDGESGINRNCGFIGVGDSAP